MSQKTVYDDSTNIMNALIFHKMIIYICMYENMKILYEC